MFEVYQREAKAARDKRDKEEIETLRNEVQQYKSCRWYRCHSFSQLQEVHEELQRREARWSSTLVRYRLKIESLEAQNKELQGDLRVMEQERLQWWQQQVRDMDKGTLMSRHE